ncbi:MAG: tripartite tricarboxylate transporter permease [DPANN group archaeon]|nr:tripartite tricarboxylate transporter permease [DPANN group archaeon]
MLDLLAAFFLGVAAGTITGLMPGIHTNTVAVLAVGALPTLTKYFSLVDIGIFLSVMVVVHSFLDFIPSIFLGAPESDTVLGVLPGHRMLLRGEGYDALKLTVAGGLGSFVLGLALLPAFFVFVEKGYPILEKFVVPIIISFSAIFILLEKNFKKMLWAVLIFMMSAVLGLLVLNNISIKDNLFPMLSGLFGVSTLIISSFSTTKIVEQKFSDEIKLLSVKSILSYVKATLSSALMSLLPALGSAQAAVISQAFAKNDTEGKEFLVIVGGINTVSAIFVLTTLYLIGRARTGVIAAMKQFLMIDFNTYLILLAASFAAAGISVILTLKLGKLFANKIQKLNYRKLSIGIIIFISALVAIFSGWLGLLVLSVSTAIGLLAPLAGCKRIHAMGCLVIPIVLYFI